MDAAHQFGLTKHSTFSAKTSPPVSLPFIKHKSDGFEGTRKWRLLFSHCNHPLRCMGLIRRCLTVLIKTANHFLRTWAILDVREVRDYVAKLSSTMNTLYPSGAPSRQNVRLFELARNVCAATPN